MNTFQANAVRDAIIRGVADWLGEDRCDRYSYSIGQPDGKYTASDLEYLVEQIMPNIKEILE